MGEAPWAVEEAEFTERPERLVALYPTDSVHTGLQAVNCGARWQYAEGGAPGFFTPYCGSGFYCEIRRVKKGGCGSWDCRWRYAKDQAEKGRATPGL
jgi:hypothetical protein